MPTKTSLNKAETVQVPLADLIAAEYNPRQITENQFNDLKDSIQNFGFVEPIIANENINRKNVVIGGHQRIRVAEFLNMKSVPVVYVNLSEEKEKELNIRLNANGGTWDWDVIANEWDYSLLRNWGLNVPNPTFDYPELLDDAAETISTENAGTDRSDFIISMSKENKQEFLEIINRIKLDSDLIDTEDVIMLIARSYA
tara:strand:- start:2093 stop:2689 length:597 start_codon:yes stop_codon:yes gene_type:complete